MPGAGLETSLMRHLLSTPVTALLRGCHHCIRRQHQKRSCLRRCDFGLRLRTRQGKRLGVQFAIKLCQFRTDTRFKDQHLKRLPRLRSRASAKKHTAQAKDVAFKLTLPMDPTEKQTVTPEQLKTLMGTDNLLLDAN